MSKKAKTIRDCGEFGLIQRIESILKPKSPEILVGLGDDAAVIQPRNCPMVYTTDTMVEGTHFQLDWHIPEELAHKALASNVSDLAAKCAEPSFFLVTLGLRGEMEIAWVENFYQRLEQLKQEWLLQAVGGDTVFSPYCIISMTAWGYQRTNTPVTHSGAMPGDSIFVTGTLGDAAAGLELLRSQSESLAAYPFLRERFCLPTPRWKEALEVAKRVTLHSMTDISDGLARDLLKVCRASGCGAWIDGEKLPGSTPLRNYAGDRWMGYAWRGGEDYELLFTIPREEEDLLLNRWPKEFCTLTYIGEIRAVEEGISVQGLEDNLDEGFDHFKEKG